MRPSARGEMTSNVIVPWCQTGMRVVYVGPRVDKQQAATHGIVQEIIDEFWARVEWHTLRGTYVDRTLIYHMEPEREE